MHKPGQTSKGRRCNRPFASCACSPNVHAPEQRRRSSYTRVTAPDSCAREQDGPAPSEPSVAGWVERDPGVRARALPAPGSLHEVEPVFSLDVPVADSKQLHGRSSETMQSARRGDAARRARLGRSLHFFLLFSLSR